MSTPAADAWLESIRELVRAEVRTALAFSGLCEYRVVASPGAGGNNTIDAVPVDQQAGLPPVQGVSVRTGLPGGSVQVAPNARVALAFLDQNPSKPYFVGAFDSTSALQITILGASIVLGDTGAAPLAKASWVRQLSGALQVFALSCESASDPTVSSAATALNASLGEALPNPVIPAQTTNVTAE